MSTAITDSRWELLMRHGNLTSIARSVGVSVAVVKLWRDGVNCPSMASIEKIQAAFPRITTDDIRDYWRTKSGG